MRRPFIEGWTSDAEAAELARLAAGKTVLEVGAYKGFGTVLMAQAGATVWAVDWHRGDPDLGPKDTLCAWWTNVRRHHVEDRVIGLVGDSIAILERLQPEMFDLAFVDAYHQYNAVKADSLMAELLVKSGGLLAFHDYCPTWPGVVQVVEESSLRLGSPIRLVGSLAIVEVKRDIV